MDEIEAILEDYKQWLPEHRVHSLDNYTDTIKNHGDTFSRYVQKNDISEWTKKDCETIVNEIDRIFPNKKSEQLSDPKSHIKKFGEYLEQRKNNSNTGGPQMTSKQTDKIKEILDDNYQVILTGAPGTGKTFTVKNHIEGKQHKFVQFHPSYDYSDFVEGLRPVPDSRGGNQFVRLDGSFKAFCRKIVTDELETIKKASSITDDKAAFEKYKKNCRTPDLKNEYYFIIDEINRADLSKVFGEIMYCLDEDYRGPGNAIETQYSALKTYHKDKNGNYTAYIFDCFENGFFIPSNLHIIGTMNDIDRSVESFDFALRRRFMWIEVDANDSIGELDKLVHITTRPLFIDVDELKNRAKQINNLLVDKKYARLGLTKQFQLGKAYYKKFDGSEKSLESIYQNKIKPIVKEYTRGRDSEKVQELLDEIHGILLDQTPTTSGNSTTSSSPTASTPISNTSPAIAGPTTVGSGASDIINTGAGGVGNGVTNTNVVDANE